MNYKYLVTILSLFCFHLIHAQDVVLNQILNDNSQHFSVSGTGFKGSGWESIYKAVNESDNVLIGEEHFTNEIPFFTRNIISLRSFDNFYIEVDPYSTEIIENSIRNLSSSDRAKFNEKYKDLFSFYSLVPEYQLLKDIVESGINLIGSDQIIMYADRLIFQEIVSITKNAKAKALYKEVIDKSKSHLQQFFTNPKNPMYMITPEFSEIIKEIAELDISKREHTILASMLKSVEIYQSGPNSHSKRVTLLKHHLMQQYELWKDQKNLFKYGANHMTKGESLLSIFDIGNLINNISDANGMRTLHILIIGQSGMLGQPFRIFPEQPVNRHKWPLKNLKPFLTADNDQWKVFDLNAIKSALKDQQYKLNDLTLRRVIKGYDLLVVIPEVTAAKF